MNVPRQEPVFDGHRILVAEDELLLAMEIRRFLEDWGCLVLGPVPSVSRALALLAEEAPDGAVLDVNLKGELAAPVAEALAAREVPFVLLTGYGVPMVTEPVLRAAPRLDKPVSPVSLEAALMSLFDLRR